MGSLIGSSFRNALAMRLNGTTQYGYRDDPSFKANAAGAFSLWLRPTTVLTSNRRKGIIGMGPNDAANNSFFWLSQRYQSNITPTQRLDITTRATHGGNAHFQLGSTSLVAGSLYHIVGQSNGSTTSIYVNGVAETITSYLNNFVDPPNASYNNGQWLGSISGANKRLTFGCEWFTNAILNPGDENIDEVNYFDRALTGAEITALYNGGVPNNPYSIPSLLPNWKTWLRCGDSRDTNAILYDEIGTNNITLVNTPTFVTP